jgi:poly(beta-D-mannuronate) C5 epimerase
MNIIFASLIIGSLSSFSYNNFSNKSSFVIQIANATEQLTSNHITPSLTGFDVVDNKGLVSNISASNTTISNSHCVSFDPTNRTVTITCSSARLSDVYKTLNDSNILTRQTPEGTWFLSANLVIAKGATFHIDPTDTKWLKINSKSESSSGGSKAYIVDVFGSLKINSVKITSWDLATNSYAITNGSRHGDTKHAGHPRPYFKVESGASGTTDILNSEIAYLGYEKGKISGQGTDGLNYYGGDGSVLRGNNIHDLYFGFYSSGVGHIVIENNIIRNSGHYGLDPHTGTHDMIIRNNTVYGNKGIGIICSLNCYNILIENNKVHDNAGYGIMFSRNMTNSIARSNIVYNEDNGIFVSESHGNQMYKNIVSNSMNGINIGSGSSDNKIYNNTITKSNSQGISVSSKDLAANKIYSNIIR